MRWVKLLLMGVITMPTQPFTLLSRSFARQEQLPLQYTCDGANIPPVFYWKNAPTQTKSFVFIIDDPDAHQPTPFVHWIVIDIPADVHQLRQENSFPQGKNDFGTVGYGGPCPPAGATHTYRFTIYALDTTLNLKQGYTLAQVTDAMKDHILATAQLKSTYKRK